MSEFSAMVVESSRKCEQRPKTSEDACVPMVYKMRRAASSAPFPYDIHTFLSDKIHIETNMMVTAKLPSSDVIIIM